MTQPGAAMQEPNNHNAGRLTQRWLTECIFTRFSLPIMCGCVILLLIVFFTIMDALFGDGKQLTIPLFLLVIGMVLLFGMITVPMLIAVFMNHRVANLLDSIKTPIELTGMPGRDWHAGIFICCSAG